MGVIGAVYTVFLQELLSQNRGKMVGYRLLRTYYSNTQDCNTSHPVLKTESLLLDWITSMILLKGKGFVILIDIAWSA